MIAIERNRMPKTPDHYLSLFTAAEAARARAFHESFPQYSVTPLARLSHLAAALGVGEVFVKDESHRFGLNAFKVLGGSYAIGRLIARQLGQPIEETGYHVLTSPDTAARLGQMTFFTATDGNHGRGVAWSARELGQRAVVLMPRGTSRSRFENIRALGAEVTIESLNYDDCVRKAAALAAETPHSAVVQDTAWEGYEETPNAIMQGYATLVDEALEQMAQAGCEGPTHVFVQAGVGSLAAAVQGTLVNRFPQSPPRLVVVECDAADCFYRSARQGDGHPVAVGGNLSSMMAGLCCGEVNPVAFELLRNHAFAFASCSDEVSALGMRILTAPLRGDPRVISGESGAVGAGLLASLCLLPEHTSQRELLGIGSDSRILLLSTEGDTDPVRYRSVVWGGDLSVPV
ncbi:MAG: diaminopropionate ammonia-lyase [Oscillospiraceae bacterium]|nr:MAG: diaminopropionate ammonia-lyase [Oscillospiraceae bacterium]